MRLCAFCSEACCHRESKQGGIFAGDMKVEHVTLSASFLLPLVSATRVRHRCSRSGIPGGVANGDWMRLVDLCAESCANTLSMYAPMWKLA